ncbi:MAG TPA: hypothetical protein VGM90_07345 [Kofleriaceae bacterium]|jgi:hypothetical protein
MTPNIDNDAYNSVGEHLKNDEEQSRLTMAAVVLAAIVCAAMVLLVVLR